MGGGEATRVAPGGGTNEARMALASASARCRGDCSVLAEPVPPVRVAAAAALVSPAAAAPELAGWVAAHPVTMSAAHMAAGSAGKDPRIRLMPDRRRGGRHVLRLRAAH
jgi:hypothetical protein